MATLLEQAIAARDNAWSKNQAGAVKTPRAT